MKKICVLILICLPVVAYNQIKDRPVIIGKIDSLYSKALNESRPYWVYLPQNDATNFFQPGRYPVLYLLDGDAHFHSVSGLVQILSSGINGTFVIPEMIVIGIPNTDRTRDLTPTHSDKSIDGKEVKNFKTSGGGNNFLKFLKEELIPHIDSAYTTLPYRVLVGHSIGGITVINALYTMPDLFNAYVAIDPSLWWDQQVLLQKGKTFFRDNNLTHKSLFLAQANTISVEDPNTIKHFEPIKEFAKLLETNNRSGLRWRYKYYDNDRHGSVALIAEYDGLRFIFDSYNTRFKIGMSPEKLKNHFQGFSEETNVNFTPPEAIINSLGNEALFSEKYDLALHYFQMSIDFYPQSSNAYSSMGEAWTKKGDVKKAIEYYEKSLKLNPQNENAKAKIKKLKEQPVEKVNNQ